jgi:hypothetical protein
LPTALLVAPVALAAPAIAQPPASPLEGITPAQARSLPPGELAERAFRQVAGQMRTMTRPYVNPADPDRALYELVFATAPVQAGDAGQCLATVVHVGQLRAPDDSLMNDGTIATEVVYKVVGDVEPEAGWSDAYATHLAQLCRDAGPVILADETSPAQPTFFHLSGARLPTLPLIALQRAIREARAGSYTNVGCERVAAEEAAEACRDPRTLLAGLDLANLTNVEISRPGQRETQYRVEGTFRTAGSDLWRLSLDLDFSVVEMRREFRLGHSEISRIIVFDVADAPPPLPGPARRP